MQEKRTDELDELLEKMKPEMCIRDSAEGMLRYVLFFGQAR